MSLYGFAFWFSYIGRANLPNGQTMSHQPHPAIWGKTLMGKVLNAALWALDIYISVSLISGSSLWHPFRRLSSWNIIATHETHMAKCPLHNLSRCHNRLQILNLKPKGLSRTCWERCRSIIQPGRNKQQPIANQTFHAPDRLWSCQMLSRQAIYFKDVEIAKLHCGMSTHLESIQHPKTTRTPKSNTHPAFYSVFSICSCPEIVRTPRTIWPCLGGKPPISWEYTSYGHR